MQYFYNLFPDSDVLAGDTYCYPADRNVLVTQMLLRLWFWPPSHVDDTSGDSWRLDCDKKMKHGIRTNGYTQVETCFYYSHKISFQARTLTCGKRRRYILDEPSTGPDSVQERQQEVPGCYLPGCRCLKTVFSHKLCQNRDHFTSAAHRTDCGIFPLTLRLNPIWPHGIKI